MYLQVNFHQVLAPFYPRDKAVASVLHNEQILRP